MSLKDEYDTKLQEVERGDFGWLHDEEKYSQAIEELIKALTAQQKEFGWLQRLAQLEETSGREKTLAQALSLVKSVSRESTQ